MGTDANSYLLAVLGELLNSHQAERGRHALPSGDAVLESLDALIRVQGVPDPSRVCLESVLTPHLREMAAVRGRALQAWILGLVGSPQYRVGGAQRAADCVAEYLRTLSREAGQAIQASLEKLRTLRQALLSDKHGSRHWLRRRGMVWRRRLVTDPRLSQYFHESIEEMALGAVCRLTGLILAQVVAAGDKLRNLAADLNRLAEESPTPDAATASSATDSRAILARMAIDTISEHKLELVAEMETALEEYLRRAANIDENEVRRRLSPVLRRTARATILRMFKKVTLQQIAFSERSGTAPQLFSLRDALKAALPSMRGCGGAQRLLVLAPKAIPTGQLVEHFDRVGVARPTVVADTQDDVLVCYEAEQLPLRRVAAAVLDRRFHNVEVASRLHTRIDITWSPL